MSVAEQTFDQLPMLDELCTPPAVAAILNVSAPTVYSALRRSVGGLSHLRTPGGQIRVRRRDVLAYCHQVGMAVPPGLVPRPAEVVAIHPNPQRGRLIRAALEPRCAVTVFNDPVEGLIQLGARRPPLAILSVQAGLPLIARLCDAIHGGGTEDYMAVIVLQRPPSNLWEGGPVPLPLPVGEPIADGPSSLGRVVSRILGLD